MQEATGGGDSVAPSPSHDWVPLRDGSAGSGRGSAFPTRRALAPAGSRRSRAKPRPKGAQWAIEILTVLVGAVVIAVGLRMFVVQVYEIPSASMENTLQIGSRIAVNRLPVLGKQIERGDVVVFQDSEGWLAPSDNASNPLRAVGEFLGLVPPNGEQVVVKRVIGVGGDTVSCCDAQGRLMVNGVAVDEPYVLGRGGGVGDFEVTVPEGKLWVMGDNRANSADSLYHYQRGEGGFIGTDAVIGRAWGQIWPISEWSSLGNRRAFQAVPSQ